MSQTIRNGQTIRVNIETGKKLAAVAVSGTYSITVLAGTGAGTSLAANATGGTYGPYAYGLVVQIVASALAEIDFDVGVATVIDSDTAAFLATDPLTGRMSGLVNPNTGGVITLGGGKGFVRKSTTPIWSNTMQTAGAAMPSIMWFCVFPAYQYLANPLARYYGYYSTDHVDNGGIALALSDSPLGPWRQYVPSGLAGSPAIAGAIYVDNAGAAANRSTTILGSQQMSTETPSVYYDEAAGVVRMVYQAGTASRFAVYRKNGVTRSATGAQTSLSATSTDGITFTKDLDWYIDIYDSLAGSAIYSNAVPGDGHTGYFNPFVVDGRRYAYHLFGGQNVPHFALSAQNADGSWTTDVRGLPYACNIISTTPERRICWLSSSVIKTGNRLMLVALLENFISGAAVANRRIGICPIGEDLRTPIGKMDIFWTPTLSWETDDVRTLNTFVDADGSIYTYYVCRSADLTTSSVGVMSYE